MTEEIFDKLLRKALMEAVWQDFRPAIEAAENEQITYSERYLKRRERLLEDPFGYAKKMLRTPLQRVTRIAAMILLVCSILFAMAMTVPEVRAAIKRLYMEWYETHIAVYVQEPFSGDGTDLSEFHVEIPVNMLPEGYREYSREDRAGVIVYSGRDNSFISIDYRNMSDSNILGANNKGVIEQKQVVGGVEYYQLEATAESKMNQIMWVNERYNLSFRIIATKELEMERLQLLAQNVLIEKK